MDTEYLEKSLYFTQSQDEFCIILLRGALPLANFLVIEIHQYVYWVFFVNLKLRFFM